jgi:hypothetical protein
VKEVDVAVGMFRWLAIVLVAGLILNSQQGVRTKWLVVASGLCALTLILGTIFQAFVICRAAMPVSPPFLSGINLCSESIGFLSAFLIFIFMANGAGILLGSFSRPFTVYALENIELFAKKAKKIERALRTLAITIAAIFLAIGLLARA